MLLKQKFIDKKTNQDFNHERPNPKGCNLIAGSPREITKASNI